MAQIVVIREEDHLRGLVDMGSNGIRFSISSLQPPTARIMPTLYQHRAAISLYDAQYSASGERQPLSDIVIGEVITAFLQFKQTCADFRVPNDKITVLATEATRTAMNSEQFRNQIKEQVGWDVTMLSKEDEGRVGGMGIASSLPQACGLVMDLGGGSTQLSWLLKPSDPSRISMPDTGAVSMPYGAAALSRRMAEATASGQLDPLEAEIRGAVKAAYAKLDVPRELEEQAERQGGFSLYLSGGGFRGWGYVLMSEHRIQPYPIPVMNGFSVSRDDFLSTHKVKEAAAAALDEDEDDAIFRVSDRRASQVPAVALLVNALSEALPQISSICFCQGGVREGFLFTSLPANIQAQQPLVVATQSFGSKISYEKMVDLLMVAIPKANNNHAQGMYGNSFDRDLLLAFANMMFYHSSHSKDIQASAALHSPITGILAGVHGVLHESRAMLALLLCARWGGSVPPCDELLKSNLEKLVDSSWDLWWIDYIGALTNLMASCYPAGYIDESKQRLSLSSTWSTDSKERSQLNLRVSLGPGTSVVALRKDLKNLEKVGKPKRWRTGVGHRLMVMVDSLST